MNLTTEEIVREWDVCYQTRLGILCGTAEPTEEQKDLAAKESDEHIQALKNYHENDI